MDDEATPEPMQQSAVRIGDAERDEAVSLLQEHLTAGRLDTDEFDERIAAALRARTRGDLDVLFADLPGHRPGQEIAPEPVPAAEPIERREHSTPIYAHWALLPLVIALTATTRGSLGILIPIVAMWVFWIYPAYVAPRRPRTPTTALTAADLSQEQRREITALVNKGEKIAAIKRYRALTGADLASSKTAVETWQQQLER